MGYNNSNNSKHPKKHEKVYDPEELYRRLKKKQKHIEKCYKPTYLYNSDFRYGTYIIDEPGYYVLKEDIVFNPNPENDHLPYPDEKKYQTHAFSLGFFAAIIISCKDVYLNLNHHTIEQSLEHALQQRFFALIELADSPFMPGQGPGDFGSGIRSGRNVIIRNGTLGRSAHHGVHGNLAKWVLFEDLNITDFEVAGIALNGSDSVVSNYVKIHDSRTTVPVLATYSASRFARFFAKEVLTRYEKDLTEDQKTKLQQKLTALESNLNIAYTEIMATGQTTIPLFRNDGQIPDGNIYGFLIHPPGVAVNDLVTEQEIDWSRNVYLNRTRLENIKCDVHEIIALSGKDGKGAQNDVAGAVLQIDKITDEEGKYKGTVLSDLQIALAEIGLQLGVSLGKSNITADVIIWANNGTNIQTLLDMGYKYKCNGDSMFHVNKGAIGYRFDGVDNLTVVKCSVKNLVNEGRLGNAVLDGKYVRSHDNQTREGYCGSDTTGISYSYCRNVCQTRTCVEEIVSYNGDSVAISIINGSHCVNINKVTIDGVRAGTLVDGEWLGTDYYGNLVPYTTGQPNGIPNAIGIYISEDSKSIEIGRRSIKGLKAAGCEVPIWSH